MWEKEGREDILAYLDELGTMWVDPVTKKPIEGDCPFLLQEKEGIFSCKIQEVKPFICRSFRPNREQAKNMKCLGYEKGEEENALAEKTK